MEAADSDDHVHTLFAAADTLKASSAQTVADLKVMGVTPVRLTGNNASTARAIAAQASIEDARGDLSPQDQAVGD